MWVLLFRPGGHGFTRHQIPCSIRGVLEVAIAHQSSHAAGGCKRPREPDSSGTRTIASEVRKSFDIELLASVRVLPSSRLHAGGTPLAVGRASAGGD
jgi:hypothetical protein